MRVEHVEKLARLAALENRQALEHLYDEFSPRLYGFLADLTRDSALGEDLLHELWIRVMDKLPARSAPFRPWVFKMARNLAIDACRNRRVRSIREGAAGTACPTQGVDPEGPETPSALRRAVADLPLELREVVVLRFYSGLSFRELAAIIGCPLPTASTRLRKALASLKMELSCARL
ncbi:MAG: RNA polymerase sigma factor [Planctomycetota bacterium]|jgi:RNA polymerase sigma-70 factor (ECF subfamily)